MLRILRVVLVSISLLAPCSMIGEPLKVGLMPAVDSVPLIVAGHLGFFLDEGVEIEFVMFRSQLYRESALQTGVIDGAVSDLINALNARYRGFAIRVTSATDGRFALLASPDSGFSTVGQWNLSPRKIRTGLLENSIVFYLSERMLELEGVDPARIDLVVAPDLPIRMEMLLAGRLDAACLPEPLTRLAVAGGASIVVESTAMSETPGVLLFTEAAIRDRAGEIGALYRAYDRAVEVLVADRGSSDPTLRSVIVRLGEFPPAVLTTMRLPEYHFARLPSRELVADVESWMRGKQLLAGPVGYELLVDSRFVD